jgi:alpha-L-rhamnosidase
MHGFALSVTQLRCEMRNNPLGIETASPRLSWILTSDARGESQTAYQVLAATTPDLLQPGRADMLDTGRQDSEQSIHVQYAGKPPRSGQQVFWTVKVWGRDGRESTWAKPARWTMGLVSPADWQAQWITDTRVERQEKPAITRGNWIWHAEHAGHEVPPGTRYFRRVFDLPRDARVDAAELHLAADNQAQIRLNGQSIGEQDDWSQPSRFEIGRALKPGLQNVLNVAVTNTTDKPNPAGLIAVLTVPLESGKSFEIVTDASWQATITPPESADWKAAKVVEKWGEGPWRNADHGALQPPLPIFRREFALDKPVRRALVHVSGLGHYKLYLNGIPFGDHFLGPAWSKYQKTVYYETFDITDMLSRGRNAIGAMLGRSYYATRGDRRIHAGVFDNPPVLIAQLDIEQEDGSTSRIVTDESWRWTVGPYQHCSIIGGVDYDARLLPGGWASAGFDDSKWETARTIDPKLGKLSSATSPPLKTFDEFKPLSITEPQPGKFVYDFGQNVSATVRLKVRGPAGARLRLTYAEQRQGQSPHRNDGNGLVDQSGIGSPNYIEYTLRGGDEEQWFCDQFYTGYQYLQLDGAVPTGAANPENKPIVTDITSVHVRSSAPAAGSFACSNEMYQKIDRMIEWSVRNNLSHVLTDCPHREKLGWLEVPHLMWDSMAYRFELSGFGPKICRDITDSQGEDGMIPTVAPSYPSFGGAFGYTPEWGAAGVLIPWYVYEWYGDRRNLAASYDTMRRFVDYVKSTSTDLIPKAGLGDWYDYGHGQALGPSKFTPPELSATAIFHDCARRVADAAKVLGKDEDERAYRDLAGQIRVAFNKRFYEGNGRYKNNGSCQTANAMALVCGLVEPSQQVAVASAIVDDLKKRKYQQTSGDVGFHYLVRALTDFGHSDALFHILNRTELGSYTFLVNAGWTSLPEAWDADKNSSMNHCMLGHIQE